MPLFGGAKKQGASPSRRRRSEKLKRAMPISVSAAVPKTVPATARAAVTADFGFGDEFERAPKTERKAKEARAKAERGPKVERPAKERKPKAGRAPVQWKQLGLRSMPVIAVGLVLALLLAGWRMMDYVGSVPVSRVAVTGNLQHLDRQLLVARVQPLLSGAGFMTVDLEGIRTALMELPWVADVSIQRRWPDQLVIAVTEQEAIARWGSDGLLNRRGEVFRPQPLGDVKRLPALYGPDSLSGDVVAQYAQLRELLTEQGLALSSLGTDERGSWSATLENGVVLRLGTGDALKKIRRFLQIYRDDLSSQIDRVAYIDLRYSNGLAVGWKSADVKTNVERG